MKKGGKTRFTRVQVTAVVNLFIELKNGRKGKNEMSVTLYKII